MSAPGTWLPRGGVRTGPPTRIRAGRLALFALSVVGGLLGVGLFVQHVMSDPLVDVNAYYLAATRLNEGQPLYPPDGDPNLPTYYFYPPLLAVLLRPLALLPYHVVAVAWGAAMAACLVLTVRRLGARRPVWLALGLLGMPIGFALSVGQAHPLVVLLVALGQPWAIALATNLKLFPALVAVWWIGRRDWAALAAFTAWLLLLALFQFVLAPQASIDFLGVLSLDLVADVRNWSPYAVSPESWVVLVALGALVALRLAPGRWGWPAAVALATLTPPRLLLYMFMGLLSGLRQPDPPRGDAPDLPPGAYVADPVEAYTRSAR